MILPTESFATDIARVRTFIRVRPLVDEKIVTFRELPIAKFANKLLLRPGGPARPRGQKRCSFGHGRARRLAGARNERARSRGRGLRYPLQNVVAKSRARWRGRRCVVEKRGRGGLLVVE